MNDAVVMVDPRSDTPAVEASLPAPTEKSHVCSLDGLRGIAVLAILVAHTGVPGHGFLVMGVDLFFVLSGFLITTLLAREWEQAGRISLPRFWARRALRLMPAYWLFVGTMTALMIWGPFPLEAHNGWSPGWHIASMWLYFANYLPLGGFSPLNSMTYHLWSLCIEEQFYFIWPFLCVFIFRLKRPYLVPCVILLAMLLLRTWWPNDVHTYQNRLETRGIGLVFGCTAALLLCRMEKDRVRQLCSDGRLRGLSVAAVIATVGATAVLMWTGCIDGIFMYRWMVPPVTLSFAVFVGMMWYGPEGRIGRALSWRPLAYLGTISYGIYLYQTVLHELTWKVVLAGISHWQQHIKFATRCAFFFSTSIGVAALSYHLYERRFLAMKHRFR